MAQKKLPRYSRPFKERAIQLAEEIGPTRASRVLGVPPGTLGMMIRLRELNMKSTNANTPAEKAAQETAHELRRLRKENEDLKKANLILREVASIFSKDPLPTSLGWSERLSKKGQK